MKTKQAELIRRRLKLTRDLVPIHYSVTDDYTHQCSFVCPLPRGFLKAVEKLGSEVIKEEILKMIDEINEDAVNRREPFENILLGYYGRSDVELEKLLKSNQISKSHLMIREKGLGSVYAGENINSGDIYLSTDSMCSYDIMIGDAFKDFFEPRTAFHCHNVDYYWQALLTRELVIRYFNFLSEKIQEIEYES